MKTTHYIGGLCLCLLSMYLTGCPRFASVLLYNNTSTLLIVNTGGNKIHIEPKKTASFRFTTERFEIDTGAALWTYGRNIPHRGEAGPYFDGTIRLQVQTDGTVFVLRTDEMFPKQNVTDQPDGFPLHPQQAITETR